MSLVKPPTWYSSCGLRWPQTHGPSATCWHYRSVPPHPTYIKFPESLTDSHQSLFTTPPPPPKPEHSTFGHLRGAPAFLSSLSSGLSASLLLLPVKQAPPGQLPIINNPLVLRKEKQPARQEFLLEPDFPLPACSFATA